MDIVEKIQNLSAREKAIIALTVLVVFLYVPYSFIYQPERAELARKHQALDSLTTELNRLNSSLVVKVGQEKSVDMPVITLPEAQDLAQMLDSISREAERNGVEFISITQEGFSQVGPYVQMKCKVEIRSRFRPLNKFLRQLSDKHRLFMIQSLRYETNEALYPSGVAILKAVALLEKK